jgi:DNA-directed RNA polymerase subunit RPC12/RpoP
MGEFSGTPEGEVMMFRCGCVGGAGCGKIRSEGQVQKKPRCPRCGSRYLSPYYPQSKWQKFKCYLKLMRTGEVWLRS